MSAYEHDHHLLPIWEKVAAAEKNAFAFAGAMTAARTALPKVLPWMAQAAPKAATAVAGWFGKAAPAAAEAAGTATKAPGLFGTARNVAGRAMGALGRGGQYVDLAPGAAKWEQRAHTLGRWGSNVSGVAGVAGMVGIGASMLPGGGQPPPPTNNIGANGGNGQQPGYPTQTRTASLKLASGSPMHNARAIAGYGAFAAPYVAPHFFEQHPELHRALNLGGLAALTYNGVESFGHGADDPAAQTLDLAGLALMLGGMARQGYVDVHGVKTPGPSGH